jgi:predicted lipoprotein with Yx(FWY)xxD motif
MTLRQYIQAALAIGGAASAMYAAPASAASAAAGASLPQTTPDGVTLIEVSRELPISQPIVLFLRPGDDKGHTLFTYEKDAAGVSKCDSECSKEFVPFAAATNAKVGGDWSLVRRKDGARQLAYQGQPLYVWSKEQNPGEVATNVGLAETANGKFAEDPVKAGSLMPPAGWLVARLNPAKMVTMPDGIDARMVPTAEAVILTDFNGRTLYSFSGDAKQDAASCVVGQCERRWQPLVAPEMASGVGEFSLVTRSDGVKQWAYRKKALYLFDGDKLPGDVNGVGVDPRWTTAALTEAFRPARVGISNLDGYGNSLALDGFTLYGGYQFEKRWGGRNLRDTFTNIYWKGKKLGAMACDDDECLKVWHPFAAPADAVANGFWEPVTRSDGTKQWAYKGYALYTYAKEDAPKEHYAQAVYSFSKIDGNDAELKRAAFLEELGKTSGGAGIYWSVARP